MKVVLERNALLKSLGHVQSVVERRNTIPILANVLIKADKGTVSFTATDMDLEMNEQVAADVGKPGANIARLRFGEKRDVVLMVADKEVMRGGYQINLYGEKGWRSITPDLKNLYAYLLEAFLDLVITGKESVPIEEEVEVIAALEAAKRSLELGREVKLSEVLAGL